MASLIEDYALLSNMRTGPLVSRTGSIDWLCAPRFDSPSVFGALLGEPDHGRWLLAPACTVAEGADGEVLDEEDSGAQVAERFYVENTFVLQTVWVTDSGSVRVTDFLPLTSRTDVVRRVEGLTGEVEMYHELRVRFGYGAVVPWVSRFEGEEDPGGGDPAPPMLVAMAGPDALVLRGEPLPESTDDDDERRHRGTFTVSAGQARDFVLTHFPSHRTPPAPVDVNEQLTRTVELWQDWSGLYSPPAVGEDEPVHIVPVRGHAVARRSDVVRRSLLVVRALMHQETGGLVAAPTTSLPDVVGGERNWDHRFAWLRDAAMALEVMLDHDHDREAAQLRNWLLRAVAGDPHDLQNIYGVAGERRGREHQLDLPGYERSRPVREGNGAAGQHQSDAVGHVMVVFEKLRRRGAVEDHLSWPLQQAMLRSVVENYEVTDQGLWEMRGERQYYTHSRVLMWAALQCGVDAVRVHGLPGDAQLWEQLRDALAEEIWTSGYDPEVGSFVQYYGAKTVDASLLQLPQVGFVAYDDERMLGTVRRIEEELRHPSGLIHRYRNVLGPVDPEDPDAYAGVIGVDGFPGQDNPHLGASLWLAAQYARSGRPDSARKLVDSVLSRANDLGLLSTEWSPEQRRMTGNFPQTFTHLALVQALDALDAAQGRRAPAAPHESPAETPDAAGAGTGGSSAVAGGAS
ncbi:glycoside hydrolase family 15 protein [Kocuria sp. CPCC 205258]|uniref:glycoside hydrolase family 15 protein n=1 Tax=Kocuria sp. CPCC 205258 TaxID=3073552 RepID=UPI0034D79B7F